MPDISQYRTPIPYTNGLAYHYSWVMTDKDGVEHSIDGWPTLPDGKAATGAFVDGKPLKALIDNRMDGNRDLVGRYTGSTDEIDRRWKAAEAAMNAINAAPPSYVKMDSTDIMGDKETIPATNSNSVHATIGKAMGFDTSDQVGGHAPGMNRQLLPDTFAPPGEKLPPARLTSPDQHSGLTPDKAAEQNMTAG